MMLIRLLAACFCTLVFYTPAAEARSHRQPVPSGLHPMCNILWPCEKPYASSVRTARETRGKYVARELGFGAPVRSVQRPAKTIRRHVTFLSRERDTKRLRGQPSTYETSPPSFGYGLAKPLRYISGRLICAVNVNSALAERGIRGTGSALAMSFRTWGHSAGGPVPGAV